MIVFKGTMKEVKTFNKELKSKCCSFVLEWLDGHEFDIGMGELCIWNIFFTKMPLSVGYVHVSHYVTT